MSSPTLAGLTLASMEEMGADYGRFVIHGPQGSGKTYLASTIAQAGKTLFVDLTGERGTRSFQGAPWAPNVSIVRPPSVTALDDIFWALNAGGHGFKAVVIDSATALQKMTMRYLLGHDETAVKEIRQGAAPADMRTWGQALDVMTDTATFWFGLADAGRAEPMHVIMTAQTKVNEDEVSGTVMRVPDVQRGALSIMLASPDYILYTDTEEDLEAISDDGTPTMRHIVRFGSDPSYRIKARVPYNLRGKIPSILGRRSPASLTDLGRVLGLGGVPAKKRAVKDAPQA